MANLTPYQKQVLVNTVLGEAANQGAEGMQAVASVIRNRSTSGQFSSDPAAVALQSNQFSANNPAGTPGHNNVAANASATARAAATAAVDAVFNGDVQDPTGGALYYYAPAGMTNGQAPSWAGDMHQTAQIGGHLFYSPSPTPPNNVPAVGSAYADTSAPIPQLSPAQRAINSITSPDGSTNWGQFYSGLAAPVPLAPDMRQADQMVSNEFASLQPRSPISDLGTLLAMNPVDAATPTLGGDNAGYPTMGALYPKGMTAGSGALPLDANYGLAPLAAPPPAAAATPTAPQTVTVNGHTYQVGQILSAGGNTYKVQPDGTFAKAARDTFGPGTVAGGVLGDAVTGALGSAAAAAPAAFGNIKDKVGGFLGGLFGGGGAPSAPATPAPTAGSAANTASWNSILNSAGIGAPPTSRPVQTVPIDASTGQPISAAASNPGSGYDSLYGRGNGGIGADAGAYYTNQGIAGTEQLPAGYHPAANLMPSMDSVPTPKGNPGTAYNADTWHSLIDSFNSGASSMPMNSPTPAYVTQSAPVAAVAPTTRQVTTQQLNPAYTAWLNDQNSAIYGVPGVESPTLDANGNVVLPSSYVGAAPPQYTPVTRTVTVPGRPAVPARGIAAALAPAPVVQQPIAAPNGYLYQPNGNGGYNNVGSLAPGLSPSQLYQTAAGSNYVPTDLAQALARTSGSDGGGGRSLTEGGFNG